MLAGRFASAAVAAAALPLRERETAPRRRPVAVPRTKQARPDLPLGARFVGWLRALPDHRLLDRLIGGRIWIVLIGTLLVGLVSLQLSLLKLNAGIGTAVEQSAKLTEQNAALRAANSRLTDSERVVASATQMGLVMPPQGSPRFLSSRATDAGAALRNMRVPAQSAAAAPIAGAAAAGTTTGTAATDSTATGATATGAGATDPATTGTTTTDTTGTGTAATDPTGTGTTDPATAGATGTETGTYTPATTDTSATTDAAGADQTAAGGASAPTG